MKINSENSCCHTTSYSNMQKSFRFNVSFVFSVMLFCFGGSQRAATLEIVTVVPLETSQCKFYPLFGESEVKKKESSISM